MRKLTPGGHCLSPRVNRSARHGFIVGLFKRAYAPRGLGENCRLSLWIGQGTDVHGELRGV